MDQTIALAIIILAALIHASFQLSVSVLTLLSSRAIGAEKSHAKVLRLNFGFLAGVGVMTLLCLSLPAYLLQVVFLDYIPIIAWNISALLLLSLGLCVWLFYYRKSDGTSLWIPRSVATYLDERTKATKRSFESFMLGMATVVGELFFLIGPILVCSLCLTNLEPHMQVLGLIIYSFVSMISLLIVSGLIGSGHHLSRIQKWRESNKKFLQFAAGSGLIILAFYIYAFISVNHVTAGL